MFDSTKKIVVYAYHQDNINEIIKQLHDDVTSKIFMITREQTVENRKENIDNFNASSEGIMICSLARQMSVGINLQSASTAIFTELTWTPGDHLQAEDRLHRIGQKNVVNVYYLLGNKTIEQWIWSKIDEKQRNIEVSVDGIADDEEPKGILYDIGEYFKSVEQEEISP